MHQKARVTCSVNLHVPIDSMVNIGGISISTVFDSDNGHGGVPDPMYGLTCELLSPRF